MANLPDARVSLEVRAEIASEADLRDYDIALDELAGVAERVGWESELRSAISRLRRVRESLVPRVQSEG